MKRVRRGGGRYEHNDVRAPNSTLLEFSRLTEGKHPQTEEQMLQHGEGKEYTNPDGSETKPVEHRAGWDATFSAPKSVRLPRWWAVTSG